MNVSKVKRKNERNKIAEDVCDLTDPRKWYNTDTYRELCFSNKVKSEHLANVETPTFHEAVNCESDLNCNECVSRYDTEPEKIEIVSNVKSNKLVSRGKKGNIRGKNVGQISRMHDMSTSKSEIQSVSQLRYRSRHEAACGGFFPYRHSYDKNHNRLLNNTRKSTIENHQNLPRAIDQTSPVNFQIVNKSEIEKEVCQKQFGLGALPNTSTKEDNHVEDFLQWVDDLPLVAFDRWTLQGIGEGQPRKEKSIILAQKGDENIMKSNDNINIATLEITEGSHNKGDNDLNVRAYVNTWNEKNTDLTPSFNISDKIDRSIYKYALKSSLHLKTNWDLNENLDDKFGRSKKHPKFICKNTVTSNENNNTVHNADHIRGQNVNGNITVLHKIENKTNLLEINAKSLNVMEKFSIDSLPKLDNAKSQLPFNKIYNDVIMDNYIQGLRQNGTVSQTNERSPSVLTLTMNESKRVTRNPAHIERSIISIERKSALANSGNSKHRKFRYSSSKSAPERWNMNLNKSNIEPVYKTVDIFENRQNPKKSNHLYDHSDRDSMERYIYSGYQNSFPPKLFRHSDKRHYRPKVPQGFVLCPMNSADATPL